MRLLGIEGEVLRMTQGVILVLCLLPVVVNVRNYYHGIALIQRTTGRMGAGAVFRNLATYLISAAFFYAGWLNHVTAALTLVLGFVAETAMVIAAPGVHRCLTKSRQPR